MQREWHNLIYVASISIPANTLQANPHRQSIKLCNGLIYKIRVSFPSGCAGLARFIIKRGGQQLYPSSPDEAFLGDGENIDFDELYLIETPPYELLLEAWNTAEDFSHTPILSIGMVSKEVFKARFLPTYSTKEFEQLLNKVANEQEEQRKILLSQILPSLRQ